MSSKVWNTFKLSEVGKIVTGKTPKTSILDNYGDDIPFLTPSDDLSVKHIRHTARKLSYLGLSEVKNCLLPSNSICVSCIGSDLGKVTLTTTQTITNQQINSIIPNERFDPDFIYYAMVILGERLNYLSKSSTAVPIVNKSDFSNNTISAPIDKNYQKQISAVLSCLDNKIENNTQINQTLESIAQTLFKSWFVEFDPVKAKIAAKEEGKDPQLAAMMAISGKTAEQIAQLPADKRKELAQTADLFSDEMVESELGMIPRGWKIETLKDLLNIKYGKDHKKLIEGKIPVFGSGGIMRYADQSIYANESVLIPRKGSLNNVMYVDEPFWTVDTMFYTVMKRPSIAKYVYQFIKTLDLPSMNVGSAVPSMTVKILNAIPIVVSSENLIKVFDQIITSLYNSKRACDYQNRILSSLRNVLLPKLLSGEIEIQ